MNLQKLRELINSIPKEFDSFEIACSEYKFLEEEYIAREDKPIREIQVDEENREIVFVNDVSSEILAQLNSVNNTVPSLVSEDDSIKTLYSEYFPSDIEKHSS